MPNSITADKLVNLFDPAQVAQVIQTVERARSPVRDLIFQESKTLDQYNLFVEEDALTISNVTGAYGSSDPLAIGNRTKSKKLVEVPEFRVVKVASADEINKELKMTGQSLEQWRAGVIQEIRENCTRYIENFCASAITGSAKINVRTQEGTTTAYAVTYGTVRSVSSGITVIDATTSGMSEIVANLEAQLRDIRSYGGTADARNTITLVDDTTWLSYMEKFNDTTLNNLFGAKFDVDGSLIIKNFRVKNEPCIYYNTSAAATNAITAKYQVMIDTSGGNKINFLQVANIQNGFVSTPLLITPAVSANGLKFEIIGQSKPVVLFNYKHANKSQVLT